MQIFIDLIPNFEGALLKEKNFSDFLVFANENRVYFFSSWFKQKKEFDHEVSEYGVTPGVAAVLDFDVLC